MRGTSMKLGTSSTCRGRISLVEAVAESKNTVFVPLTLDLDLENVAETARDMDLTIPVSPYPATAIGGLGTGAGALEMVAVYTTFVACGVYWKLCTVERVHNLSSGESSPIYGHKVLGRSVLSGNQAAVATEVLRRAVQGGTSRVFHVL